MHIKMMNMLWWKYSDNVILEIFKRLQASLEGGVQKFRADARYTRKDKIEEI